MRFTTKIVNNYIVPDNEENIITKSLNKLGQLEDIEEELGIDLITLFKALKNGVWVKAFVGIVFIQVSCNYFAFLNNEIAPMIYYFKDYGKTWALTKEELE